MPQIQSLPAELLLSITKLLSYGDRKSLSAVNANFRDTIAPRLYKTLNVDCPLAKNQSSSLNETVQKYGACVAELRLNVTFYPRQQRPEDTNEDTPWFWTDPPASVWARDIADVDTIRDLLLFKGLPHCQTLTVYTNGYDNFSDSDIGGEEAEWDDDVVSTSIYFCKYPEEWEDVFLMEEGYSWRAALRDMYRDIATFSPTKDLKFLNFLPRMVSIWQEPDGVWSAFLGRLKKLTLHTYGGETNCGDADVTLLQGFQAFFNELSSVLFTHATELECLEIVALANGYLGVGTLYLSHLTMPKLQVAPALRWKKRNQCPSKQYKRSWNGSRRNAIRSKSNTMASWASWARCAAHLAIDYDRMPKSWIEGNNSVDAALELHATCEAERVTNMNKCTPRFWRHKTHLTSTTGTGRADL